MSENHHNQQKGLVFKKEINLGHLITLGGLIATCLGGWTTLNNKVGRLEWAVDQSVKERQELREAVKALMLGQESLSVNVKMLTTLVEERTHR